MKRVLILVAIFVVLLGTYLFLTREVETELIAPEDLSFENWSQDNIKQMKLVFSDNKEISVTRPGVTWAVNGFEASANKMQQVFTAFEELSITEKVSSNSDNHSRFDLGDQAVSVTVTFQNDKEDKILLGKKSQGVDEVYVRKPDSDEVFILRGLSRHLIVNDISAWRERKILGSQSIELTAVDYKQGPEQWRVLQTENSESWEILYLNQSTELDTNQVDGWLTRISNLSADDFLNDDELNEISAAPSETITLTTGTQACSTATWEIYPAETEEQKILVSKYQPDCSFGNDLPDRGYLIQTTNLRNVFQSYAETLKELTPQADTSD